MNEKMNELKEQIQRCEEWLREEPNDKEVEEKLTQLKSELESYTKEERKAVLEKALDKSMKIIEERRKTFNYFRRTPIIKGYEEVCSKMATLDGMLAKCAYDGMRNELSNFEKLYNEYQKLG